MLAEAAGHRVSARVAAAQADREPSLVERELLAGFVRPGPLARIVAVDESRARAALVFDRPRIEPALPVQRARVAGHVRLQPHGPPAEGEGAAADSVDVGDERETAGVEHLFERTVAFAQYRPGAVRSDPLES